MFGKGLLKIVSTNISRLVEGVDVWLRFVEDYVNQHLHINNLLMFVLTNF
jgi:hypothetical protein